MRQNMKKCTGCGYTTDNANMIFCPFCGEKLTYPEKTAEERPTAKAHCTQCSFSTENGDLNFCPICGNILSTIPGKEDSDALDEQRREKAEACRKDAVYASAREKMTGDNLDGYEAAINMFGAISGWKDADEQINICREKIEKIKAKEEADRLERERLAEEISIPAKKAAKKRNVLTAILTVVIIAGIVLLIILARNTSMRNKYNAAMELYNAQKYEDAYRLFNSLNYKDSAEKALECWGKCLYPKQKAGLTNVNVGSTIKFGFYEQDNNSSNGKEEIAWKVLSVQGNKALVISQYALDYQEYNSTNTDTTWENCTLRTWLNETFYNAAFVTEHQQLILSSTVKADKNPSFNTSPGKNTTDKVFLLSITEVNKYFKSDWERECAPTNYAKTQGPQTSYTLNGRPVCEWWLRSPGHSSNYAAFITALDFIGEYEVDKGFIAVRPAMWIDIGG